MSGVDAAFRASLDAMSDEGLRDLRFEAYDLHDIKDPDTQAFSRDLLAAVVAVEQWRALRRRLTEICMFEAPDADPAAFADAFVELVRAQRELDYTTGVVETYAAALEIACERGKAKRRR